MIWDSKTGCELGKLEDNTKLSSVTFSPDGKRLALVSDHDIVVLSEDVLHADTKVKVALK